VIIEDGIKRMYVNQEDLFYYITVENEPYLMPAMPDGAREGILRGMYEVRHSALNGDGPRAQLFGAGAILNQALAAAELLENRYQVAADVWSITSFKELHRDALEVERWNRLHPEDEPRNNWIETQLEGREASVAVIASDYVKALATSISRWFPKSPEILGTDGYGRSESRPALRRFFEVDAAHIVVAALSDLARDGKVERSMVAQAIRDFEIDPSSPDPSTV
jgi:pyruvate dehydrogenase E1 component